ncbi:MAG: flagellar basal body rod protein FlgC [Pseudomonadales bacterium]|nr:flagellar basal body rod protein FlgC [Pseudomonadales bacterium]
MSLSHIFDVAGSGMAAQTIRLNTVSSNIANAESVSSSIGETYRARHPVFSVIKAQFDEFDFSENRGAGRGVQVEGIVESQAPLRRQYQPDHPMADQEGFVFYPNVNVVEEMADMISASRSFETNVEMMNTAKQLMQRILTLGQ